MLAPCSREPYAGRALRDSVGSCSRIVEPHAGETVKRDAKDPDGVVGVDSVLFETEDEARAFIAARQRSMRVLAGAAQIYPVTTLPSTRGRLLKREGTLRGVSKIDPVRGQASRGGCGRSRPGFSSGASSGAPGNAWNADCHIRRCGNRALAPARHTGRGYGHHLAWRIKR